ncbi:MAG: hypothetical protein LWW94_09835 [Candidatus Desulfofervidaceae bacterium]|nr:hypothetical protein [Candidatus Desulfofervidaceae bacterium]
MELWFFLNQIFNDQKEKINSLEVIDKEPIPSEEDMSLEVGRWYRIRNVVSLYIDMRGSTQLTNKKYIKTSAKMYEIFTGGLIKVLKQKEFKAHFIDIKGDGGFALWKERFGSVKALLAAITFKTFVEKYLKDYVKKQITDWNISSKIGIAKGNVLVKRIGARNIQSKRYNWAVWAGKPVNISAKLSDEADGDTILVTYEVFSDISQQNFYNYLVLSCGCPTGKKVNLWSERRDLEEKFSNKIWELKSKWCDRHGEEYINKVLEIISGDEQ